MSRLDGKVVDVLGEERRALADAFSTAFAFVPTGGASAGNAAGGSLGRLLGPEAPVPTTA